MKMFISSLSLSRVDRKEERHHRPPLQSLANLHRAPPPAAGTFAREAALPGSCARGLRAAGRMPAACRGAGRSPSSLGRLGAVPAAYRGGRPWPPPPTAAASRTTHSTLPSLAAPVDAAEPATCPARSPRRWGRFRRRWTMPPATQLLVVERPRISGDCSLFSFLSSQCPSCF